MRQASPPDLAGQPEYEHTVLNAQQTDDYGWRILFFAVAGIGLVALIMCVHSLASWCLLHRGWQGVRYEQDQGAVGQQRSGRELPRSLSEWKRLLGEDDEHDGGENRQVQHP